jgi:hypothetical protein
MRVGQGMAGTGAIVRRTIVRLLRSTDRFIVRLGLIARGIRVIVRLRIHVRRGLVRLETGIRGHGLLVMGILGLGLRVMEMGTLVLDRLGMGTGIRALGLLGMAMGILALVRLETEMGIQGHGLRGMEISPAFSRRGLVIQALGLRHSRSLLRRRDPLLSRGLLIRAEVIRGRAAVRSPRAVVRAVVRGRRAGDKAAVRAVRGREVEDRDPVAVGAVRSHARRLAVGSGPETEF